MTSESEPVFLLLRKDVKHFVFLLWAYFYALLQIFQYDRFRTPNLTTSKKGYSNSSESATNKDLSSVQKEILVRKEILLVVEYDVGEEDIGHLGSCEFSSRNCRDGQDFLLFFEIVLCVEHNVARKGHKGCLQRAEGGGESGADAYCSCRLLFPSLCAICSQSMVPENSKKDDNRLPSRPPPRQSISILAIEWCKLSFRSVSHTYRWDIVSHWSSSTTWSCI